MTRARLPIKHVCHYCGVRPGTTIDHIVPRAFGGPDAMWNYVSSCESCNLSKAASWPTCLCGICTAAVDRFLSDPARRERALKRIAEQRDEMNKGIFALLTRVRRLKKHRNAHTALYSHIANYDTTWSDSIVKDDK